MKKMLVTYSLLLCFIHITVPVLAANPVKQQPYNLSVSAAKNAAVIKKSLSVPFDSKADNSADIICRQTGSRTATAISSLVVTEARFFQLLDNLIVKEKGQQPEVERVLKDHLLHIFPSHYFW